jgi:DNA-binding IscR family transcriptional regulator
MKLTQKWVTQLTIPMNSRFSIAVHILTLLASMPGARVTSELIAGSVGTNPVVIRRQLALLRAAKLVESKGARGGSWVLARKSEAIKLSQVRAALGEEAGFRMHRNEPSRNCAVANTSVRRSTKSMKTPKKWSCALCKPAPSKIC